jgi:hypothetical protein
VKRRQARPTFDQLADMTIAVQPIKHIMYVRGL